MKKTILIFTLILTLNFELSTFNSVAQTTVCQGDTVVMIVDNSVGTIQWQQSADKVVWQNIAGETDDTLKTAVADMYYRALIHDTICSHQYNYYSDTLNFYYIGFLPVSINISSSPMTVICFGTSISFSANPVNGGNNPYYQWIKNGIILSGETGQTYTSSAIANNDTVKCRVISNYQCPTGNPAISNYLTNFIEAPVTVSVSNISVTKATCSGNISYQSITDKGFCWSTSQNPTIYSNIISAGSGSGGFNSIISGLNANTTYYIRTYASNNACTSYGNQISFTTKAACDGLTTVADIDGNTYNTVAIGNQCWLKQNLKTSKYRDGSSIPNVTSSSVWSSLTTGAFCYYNNSSSNNATYGKLYNWYAATDSRNIAPTGWHLPTDAEWTQLTDYLGGLSIAGGKLKEAGTTHWQSPNTGATNESDFTSLPGGLCDGSGLYSGIGYYGDYWSSSSYSSTFAWGCGTGWDSSNFTIGVSGKVNGRSIRCIKD